jgi:hypothetical protein
VLGRLLEGSRLLVPLGAVGSKAFQALLGALLVEAGEGDRLATGVDALHQILVWRQLRLAAHRDERLDPRACSRRSSLAHLHVVRIPVDAVIAALVEPCAVVVEALTVALVVVHYVDVVGVDLEAPDRHGVVDADVPGRLNRL